MNELRKLIFISPGIEEYGDSGHYSTLHKSLERGCLQAGVKFELSGGPKRDLKAANGQEHGRSVALIYEGDFKLLQVFLEGPPTIPTYFNFLRSNDYLLLWLFMRLRGPGSFSAVKNAMHDWGKAGWVFSADSENLRRRLSGLGFPVENVFPFSSAFSGRRNFECSEWQLGLMAESRWDWTINLITAKLLHKIRPNLKIKLLSTRNYLGAANLQRFDSICVTALPAVGEEYMDRLSARIWFLPGKSSHHIFGSSGRSLDILANGGLVFTRKYNSLGAGSLNEKQALFRSGWPRASAVRRVLKTASNLTDARSLKTPSDRTAFQTVEEVLNSLGKKPSNPMTPKMELEKLARELQSFERFCTQKSTKLLFRLLLRLPRWALWKLTE